MSAAEVARRSGISRQRASVLLRQGDSPMEIISARQPKRRPVLTAAPDTSATESFASARARKEGALATMRQMELAELQGIMLKSTTVRWMLADLSIRIRDRVKLLPGELSDQLAHRPAGECLKILEDAVRQIMLDLHRRQAVTKERLAGSGETTTGIDGGADDGNVPD